MVVGKERERLRGGWTRKQEIVVSRTKEAEAKRRLRLEYLALVAREALRVNEHGEFVHSIKKEVVSALRAKMAKRASGLIRDYKDSTLARHISAAGKAILNHKRGPIYENNTGLYEVMSLREFVGLGREFREVVPSRRWRRTLRDASKVLPEDVTVAEVGLLLISSLHGASWQAVADRLAAVRRVMPDKAA